MTKDKHGKGFLASSTWKINKNIYLQVFYGAFSTFNKANEYGRKGHRSVFYFPDRKMLCLTLADQTLIPLKDCQCVFSLTDPSYMEKRLNHMRIDKISELNEYNRILTRPEKVKYTGSIVTAFLTASTRQYIKKYSKAVDVEHLYFDTPLLYEPHVTLIRGLQEKDIKHVKPFLPKRSIQMSCQGAEVLSCGYNPYAALTLRVESSELNDIHNRLKHNFNCEEDYTYIPHITVAFIKEKYIDFYKELEVHSEPIETEDYAVFDCAGASYLL